MDKRLRRVWRGWCWAVVLAALGAGTARAQPAGAPAAGETAEVVSFRAQGLPQPRAADPASLATRELVKVFQERHPHVRIEAFGMPKVHGEAMDSGPLMAIAAGVPPHAIYVNFRQSSTYIEQGFLEPLEPLLARILAADPALRRIDAAGRWVAHPTEAQLAAATEALLERVPRPVWPVVHREGLREPYLDRKHVWALPLNLSVNVLTYRKDLFAQAGLDPDRPPRNWDELLDYARRLTVPQRDQYGLMIYGGQYLSWGAYALLVSNGGRAMERGEDGVWRASFDSPPMVEATEFLWRLAREPFPDHAHPARTLRGATVIGPGVGDELDLMWQRGQVGMAFASFQQDLASNTNPQLIGYAPVPLSPRGTRAAEINAQMLGVFSGATNAQKLAITRFIWFLISEEAQAMRTRIYVQNGFGRFANPLWLERFGYDAALAEVPPVIRELYRTVFDEGVPEPYGQNTQHIYRFMSEPLLQVLEMDLAHLTTHERHARIAPVLRDAVQQTNRKLLGRLTDGQVRERTVVGWVALLLLLAGITAAVVSTWRFFTRFAPTGGPQRGRSAWVPWLMLAPALLIMAAWVYLPLGWALVLSFTDYRLATPSSFVGVMNFAEALYDPAFWASLARTLYYVVLLLALGFWPPIALAILLDEVPTRGAQYVFRTLVYLPAVISGVVVMFLWKQLYGQNESGVLNQLLLSLNGLGPLSATGAKLLVYALWAGLLWTLLRIAAQSAMFELVGRVVALSVLGVVGGSTAWLLLGGALWGGWGGPLGGFAFEPLRWIHSPQMAMLCAVLPIVWAGAGPGCLLYLAALKTVPADLYEAAEIDGATPTHKLLHITLPRLKFLIGIQFVATLIASFQGGADYILALTGGGPNQATNILALEIFIRTFFDLRFGLGTAMAWLLGLLLIGVTAYQLRQLARAQFKAT